MDDKELLHVRWATFAALTLVFGFYLFVQAPWAVWISGLVALLTASLLTAVLEFWVRLSLRRATREQRIEDTRQQLDTSRQQVRSALALQRKFLEAHSEKEILEAALDTGIATLHAGGASFVPYDEWGQSLPALSSGKVPSFALQNFAERLVSPETRQACKNCESMHGQPGCVLIALEARVASRVNCFPLISSGREVGVLNFFFDVEPEIDTEARMIVIEMFRSAGQALETLRSHDQEIAALLYLQTATTPRSELSPLLDSLVDNIRQTLDVEFALLYVPGGTPGQLQTAPQMFTSPKSTEKTPAAIPDQPFLEGIWKSVLASGHSLSLENVTLNKREVWKTLHAVPLNWQDQGPEGVLVLGSNTGHAFAQRHQALLETLAGQAALLIQNSRLIVQLEYQAVVDERARLAREIHDGLAQTLAFLKIQAAQMQNYLSRGEMERLTSTLQASYRTLSDAYIDARQAIENLRRTPSSSLADWVRQVAADYEQSTSQEVNLTNFNLEVDYPPNVQAQLIRIIQEALNNIRKHAQAKRVDIRGSQNRDRVLIEVCDDGKGFAPEQVDRNSRFGLRGMRERADSIGADFQIVSQPGDGTVVSLRIPVSVKENL